MLDTVLCTPTVEMQNQNSAALVFLILFALFVCVDSIVNATAIAMTLKICTKK